MGYVKTGPFTSGAGPGIDAGFLNNVENFLVTVNSAATDAAITSAGSGNLSTTGSITSTKATGTGLSITAASHLTGILTLDNGVNVGIIRDNVAGHNVLDLTAGDGSLKLVGASLLAHILGNLSVDGTSSLDNGNITTDGIGTLLFGKASSSVSGSVSGTANIYTPVWGPALKIAIITQNNYNSASTGQMVFPSTMSFGWFYIGTLGSSMTVGFFNGGTQQNVATTTAFGGAAAGTSGSVSNIHGDSLGQFANTTMDRVVLGTTASAAHTTTMVVIGV